MSSSAHDAAPLLTEGKRKAFGYILVAVTIAAMALITVGAELAVRYRERHRQVPPDFFPTVFYRHSRVRYGLVPGCDYFGWFRINSLGCRGKEFSARKKPGVYRIACLGGSTTFDIGCIGKDRPWPEVLEQELSKRLAGRPVEVINMAVPGSTALDSLIDLQIRGLGFEPDLVIVYQGHNDFNYSLPAGRPRKLELYPLEQKPRSRFFRWLDSHSLLYAKSEGTFSDMLGRIADPFRTALPPPSEQERRTAIDEGLSSFRRNLNSILAICEANGIRAVVPEVSIPFRPSAPGGEDCRVCAGLSGAYGGLPADEVKAVFDRYNRTIAELASRHGALFVSTERSFPADDRYYHDSVHFSPDGSLRMGALLAAAIEPLVNEGIVGGTRP